MEVFDANFAGALRERFLDRVRNATPVTRTALREESLMARTRNALCWLFSPYL